MRAGLGWGLEGPRWIRTAPARAALPWDWARLGPALGIGWKVGQALP